MKIKNSLNYQHSNQQGEINLLPSLTVPDETMTIQEILARHSHGLPTVGATRVPLYDENIDENDPEFIPDPKHMDLADRAEYSKMVVDELKQTKSNLDAASKQRKQKQNQLLAAQYAQAQEKLKPPTGTTVGT
ncbi:hypothetical protein [Blackfly microvirus SF02]|uniref:Uncharacterized protein n=1 Tax=Blackfly microvirus SF02 TaxID=2576452 RepID=A0A4P8PU31_9VIRU|nr:hypothetical protein [Blackfly microvirus SF02]